MNATQPTKPLDGGRPPPAKKPRIGARKTCYKCRGEETTAKPFVRCACTRAWHITCSTSNVELIPVGSTVMYKLEGGNELYRDFVCKRCKDEGRNVPTSTGTCSAPNCAKSAQASQNPLHVFCQEHEPKDKTQKMSGSKTCEYPSCTAPIDIHKTNSSITFCTKHKTELMFQKAQNAAKVPRPPPEPRPFKREKLKFDDEGKAMLKEQRARELHKGKRAKVMKSVSFPNEPKEKNMQGASARDVGPKQTNKPFAVSTSMLQGLDGTSTPNIASRSSAADNSSRVTTGLSSAFQQANITSPPIANAVLPTILKTISHTSSPAAVSPLVSPAAEENSPGSQLVQEAQAALPPPMELPQPCRQPGFQSSMALLSEPTDAVMTCDQSIQFANEFLMDTSDHGNGDDEDSDDYIRHAFLDVPANDGKDTVMGDAPSTNETRPSHPTMSPPVALPEIEIVAADEEDVLEMPLPANSLELIRAQKAANFDSSELDSWLAREPNPPSDIQPSAKEILETQQWGHVDPRKAWAPVFSGKWLEDKKAEIKARGGRKANYGKVITTQNRREREAKGWSIHQSEPSKVLTDERREVRRKVDELFGVSDVDDMVPEVNENGVLFMVDGEERRRKGKKTPRAYPV